MALTPSFFDQLRHRLEEPLPGTAAQYEMAHIGRQHAPEPPPDAQRAAVLALLYPAMNRWHIALIERQANNANDRHGGQIGFPGGREEEADKHLQETALREAEEEVGVSRREVEVVGALSSLYIPVSNFLVHPFVGYMGQRPLFVPQESEVRRILEVPFDHLLDARSRAKTDITISSGMVLRNVPCFRFQHYVIWGATAMMLSEMLSIAGPLAPHLGQASRSR